MICRNAPSSPAPSPRRLQPIPEGPGRRGGAGAPGASIHKAGLAGAAPSSCGPRRQEGRPKASERSRVCFPNRLGWATFRRVGGALPRGPLPPEWVAQNPGSPLPARAAEHPRPRIGSACPLRGKVCNGETEAFPQLLREKEKPGAPIDWLLCPRTPSRGRAI